MIYRLVAAFIVCAQMAACVAIPQGAEEPRVSIVDLHLIDATVLEQRYRVRVRIQNPNPFVLQIDGLHYELELNERPFMRGVSNRAVSVPRYGEAVLVVEGVSTLLGIVEQIQELEHGRREAFSYNLRGTLNLRDRLWRLPFEHRGEINFSPRPRPRSS